MGLFDFLKKQAPLPEPAATLDELLVQAASDPAMRPELYRRLLLEPLVVVTGNKPTAVEPRRFTVEAGETMHISGWDDGRMPIFTTAERIFDKGIVKHEVSIAQLKGRDLLELLRGKTLLLNPYSDYGKELLPAEVERMLAGTVLDTGHTITVQKQTKVLLGQPAVYPTEMVQALSRLLSQQPRVRAAYLGWIHDPTAPEPPHYIICLDIEGERRAVSQQMGYVAQQFLQPEEIIDIVQAGQSSLTDYFLTTKPFYER